MVRKILPERLESRERYRHDHDQNPLPDLHHQESSYRVHAEEDHVFENAPTPAHGPPAGELSYDEQYRTDGEAHNFAYSLGDDRFSEYPRYGKSINRGTRARKNFSGIGPKGYKRTDERIEEEVCEVLARDRYIDASQLTVSVDNGVVTLSGTVSDREDRFAAEMLVDTIMGVDDIKNNIKVKKYKSPYLESQDQGHI